MSTTITLARRRNAIAFITGGLNVLIAVTVLAGYAMQNRLLVTLVPGAAPMRFPTAIAVLCFGAATLLLGAGLLRTAAAAAIGCGIVGLGYGVEVIAGVRMAAFDPGGLGAPASPHVGLLIACLLILASGALLLMSGIVRPRARLAIVGVIGSVLHSIGVVAVLSYFTGVGDAFISGRFSRIAILTAIAIAAVGIAVIRFAWRDSLAAGIGTPAWLPLLVSAGTLATAFCVYAALMSHDRASFAQQVGFDSEGLRQFLTAELDNRIQPLIRLARRRAVAADAPKEEWDSDTQAILSRGGYQAIEWLDASGRVLWSTPAGAGDALSDGNAAFEDRRRAAFEAARRNRELTATRPVNLVTGGKGTVVVVPVFARDELAGYVAGVFRYEFLFQKMLASNPSPRYAVSVFDHGERIFSQGLPGGPASFTQRVSLPVGAARWQAEISPTEALVLQSESPASGALLVAGCLLAVLFGLMVHLAQMARVRPAFEHTAAAVTRAGSISSTSDTARLPVISYNRDGAALAWNETAKALFCGEPPRISASQAGFHVSTVMLLRAGTSPEQYEPLRTLLESCAMPALLFDASDRFVAANASATLTLGWTDAVWNGRSLGRVPSGSHDPIEIRNVVLMQGEWAVPSPANAAATATIEAGAYSAR